MPYYSSNKTHKGDSQVRNRLVEEVSAASHAMSGPKSMGDGSAQWTLSPARDPYKATRFMGEAEVETEDAGEDD